MLSLGVPSTEGKESLSTRSLIQNCSLREAPWTNKGVLASTVPEPARHPFCEQGGNAGKKAWGKS